MTITDDYEVFAHHYNASSDAIGRTSQIEVRQDRVWCGKHIRFALLLPSSHPAAEAKRASAPHGKSTSRGPWPVGSFRAGRWDDVVSKSGSKRRSEVEAHEARKTVHEYCPTAVKTEEASGRCRNNTWQCRCR
jgi:hypothetical protein